MTISASQVKELRERTGAGMMECKKALAENGGDMDAAIEWLRKQGLAKADKKAGRIAAEGRIALAQDGSRAVLVEINSETDFVAKDANFVAFADAVAAAALAAGGTDVGRCAVPPSPPAAPSRKRARRWSTRSARTSRSAGSPGSTPATTSPPTSMAAASASWSSSRAATPSWRAAWPCTSRR